MPTSKLIWQLTQKCNQYIFEYWLHFCNTLYIYNPTEICRRLYIYSVQIKRNNDKDLADDVAAYILILFLKVLILN